jgi:hypothetical protein
MRPPHAHLFKVNYVSVSTPAVKIQNVFVLISCQSASDKNRLQFKICENFDFRKKRNTFYVFVAIHIISRQV